VSSTQAFSPERLLTLIEGMPPASIYWVAYSGGLDSSVLLHALASVRGQLVGELRAIHIHHGLQPEADAWTAHCRAACERLGVPLTVCALGLEPLPGKSLEAVAREARYQAIAGMMGKGEMLFTAHHQDDQAETVLLHLLRGSGVDGLAAMPPLKPWRKGYLARPLLAFTRQQLRDYAAQAGLEWIEDPSNLDTSLDRNYLRREILPRLKERWPATPAAFARSAGHCADARGLLRDLAEIDLATAEGGGSDRLSLRALKKLSRARQRNLLRQWIRRQGFPVPDAGHIERIVIEVAGAGRDRMPMLKWQDTEVRRFRDELFLMRPLPAVPDPNIRFDWDGETPLTLPGGLGTLAIRKIRGEGIDPQRWRSGSIQVAFREGGERCRPCGQAHHRTLKHLFQEAGLPPWLRDRTPLIFIDRRLAAIPGLVVCHPFCARPDVQALEIRHTRPEQSGE